MVKKMKCKDDDMMQISKKSMNAITRNRLASEIISHEKCGNLNNIECAVNYFMTEYHYAWNEEKKQFCTHYREGEIFIPDGRTVHGHIDILLADPTTACLLASKAEIKRYERPKRNPWLNGQGFSLQEQGNVYRHEPELARRWRHEATAINAQVPR